MMIVEIALGWTRRTPAASYRRRGRRGIVGTMSLLPPGVSAPDGTRSERLVMRPLSVVHVEIDYDAVMSSAAMLRRWSQTSWPEDDFMQAQNHADLERHEREHGEGTAFTYTVLDPGGIRCLGCVYITRLTPVEAAVAGADGCLAKVAFWVRADEIPNDLDRHLLSVLRDWLDHAWPFDTVVFTIADEESRQTSLLEDAGLDGVPITLRDGRRRGVFR